MAAQQFRVYSSMVPIAAYALGAYRPLNVKVDGQKVRNPKFDNHSQQILNLKDPSQRWFSPAVKYCTAHLFDFFRTQIKFDRAEIIIIPSSQQGQVSAGLEQIARGVCRADKRLVYRPNALVRTMTIEKLAKGGDRSLDIHLRSLEYRAKDDAPPIKIILDDVATSCNSLGAAVTVINQIADGVTFVPVVLGKTTHD